MPGDPRLTHTGEQITTLRLLAVFQRSLALSCRACPHKRVLAGIPIWWRFERRGWGKLISDVPPRFYCSACWEGRAARIRYPVVRVTDAAPEGPQLPFPDQREWKRMVARFKA